MKSKHLFILFFLALVLRVVLSFPQYSGDLNNHLVWADSILEGPSGFYQRTFTNIHYPNYPSVMMYLFVISRFLYTLSLTASNYLNQFSIFPSNLIPFLQHPNTVIAYLKIFPIIFDLGIGFLIYQLTKSKTKLLLTSLYLFNPAVIYLSTVWGQVETISVFFCILSLYFATKKKVSLSIIIFTLAVLSKQIALFVSPLFLIIWFKLDWKKSILGALQSLVVFIISYLPFLDKPLTSKSIIEPFSLFFNTLKGSTDIANEKVWNFWHYFFNGVETSDQVLYLGIPIRIWSIFIVLVLYLVVLIPSFKGKLDWNKLFIRFSLLSLFAFFFQTRVHEKHLFPLIPYLSLVNSKLVIPILVVVSIYFLFNLQFALGLPFI